MSQRMNQYGWPIGPAVEPWSARPRPPRTPMHGRYCRLEPVNAEAHAADLHAAWSAAPDDRDWTYLFAERPATPEACRAYVEGLARTEDPFNYAIIDSATGKAVGIASHMRIDPAHGVIEVGGITYSPLLQRTRAGTEAMYLMMKRAFDELGYRRYEWKCDNFNEPSKRAALRYGFTYEGLFRKAIVYKGRSRDTAWFSIIDTEWPQVKAAFEAWAAPENFDASGKQRRSLVELRK